MPQTHLTHGLRDGSAECGISVHDGVGASIRNSIVAIARVVGPVCGHAADILLRWDLPEQIGQHRRVADVVSGDLDRPELQRQLVNSKVDLAPDASFGDAMLARVPLAFALDLDPGAIDRQMQRASGATPTPTPTPTSSARRRLPGSAMNGSAAARSACKSTACRWKGQTPVSSSRKTDNPSAR